MTNPPITPRGLNWACHAVRVGNARPPRDELDRTLDYTGSIDAALTLVPEGAIWEVGHKVHYPRPARAPDRANYAFVNVGKPGAVKSFDGKSVATPALAICAAALRARATQ
jgi:hypothetical protein